MLGDEKQCNTELLALPSSAHAKHKGRRGCREKKPWCGKDHKLVLVD